MFSNRFNPSPRAQRRNGTTDVTPAAQPALALPTPPVQELATPAAQQYTARIAVMQGVDTLAATTAPRRPFSTGSTGYNMSAKVQAKAGQSLSVQVGESIFGANVKAFSTGSHGWYAGGKTLINGVMCQVGCNLTIIGSKLTGAPAEGSIVTVQVGINATEIGSKAK